VLHYTRLERLASEKHSSLLSPFVSSEENEVLLIFHREPTRGVLHSGQPNRETLAYYAHRQ
jgi:hypothetical protein